MLLFASSTSSFLESVFEPLVVVVDRDRQDLLRGLLADHVLVEDALDLAGEPADPDFDPWRGFNVVPRG
jgi:hypothetical protein